MIYSWVGTWTWVLWQVTSDAIASFVLEEESICYIYVYTHIFDWRWYYVIGLLIWNFCYIDELLITTLGFMLVGWYLVAFPSMLFVIIFLVYLKQSTISGVVALMFFTLDYSYCWALNFCFPILCIYLSFGFGVPAAWYHSASVSKSKACSEVRGSKSWACCSGKQIFSTKGETTGIWWEHSIGQ